MISETARHTPLAVWKSPTTSLPCAFTGADFGSSMKPCVWIRWGEVTGFFAPVVMLVGEKDVRSGTRTELLEAFAREYRPNYVIELAEVTAESIMKIGRPIGNTRRLVTAPVSTAEEFETLYRETVMRAARMGGAVDGRLLIEVDPSFVPTIRTLLADDRYTGNIVVVTVLDDVEPSPVAGDAIARAADAGIFTPEGIREVAGGAPIEWVRAWEVGEVEKTEVGSTS